MIQVLVLILVLAIIGLVVAFISKLDIPAIFKNVIYLIVAVGLIICIIQALQSGHLPSVRF